MLCTVCCVCVCVLCVYVGVYARHCVCVCVCVCPLFHTFPIHYNLLLIIYWGMLTIQHDYFNNIFSGMLTTVHTEMVCMSSI